jgi:NAD(P)H-nitrite reductase large subunit
MLQRDLDSRGIAFFTNGQTEEIVCKDRAEGVTLADGRFVLADLVVLAIGIRPNIDLAKNARLDVNRGIIVSDDMRTSDPAIFAVGECVEHPSNVFGLVAPIWDQTKVCAARMAGDENALFVSRDISTSLKITGVDVFSAGALHHRLLRFIDVLNEIAQSQPDQLQRRDGDAFPPMAGLDVFDQHGLLRDRGNSSLVLQRKRDFQQPLLERTETL